MKRFFTKTGIWLLGGAAVIAVVLCIISAMGSGTSFLHNALGVIASPFRAAGSAVVNWVDGISDHFASVEELQAKPLYRALLEGRVFRQAVLIRRGSAGWAYAVENLP